MVLSYDSTMYQPVKGVTADSEDINLALRSLEKPNQVKMFAQITQDSSPGNSPFSGSASSLFTLSTDKVHVIQDNILQIILTETGGSNSITPLAGSYIFNYIQAQLNGTVIEQILPYMLYAEWICNYPQEFIVAQQDTLNIDPSTYGASQTISASGSATFYYPFTTFWNNTVFMPQCINQLQLQVYYASNPWTNVGTGNISNAYLWSSGKSYAPAIRDQIVKRMNAKPHITRTVIRRDSSLTVSSATNAQQFQQNLSALTGTYSGLKIMARPSSATRGNLYAFEPFSTISLLDSSGTPVNNIMNIPAPFLGQVVPKISCGYAGQGMYTKKVYHYPLGDAAAETELTGDSSGGVYLNGKYNIQMTPGTMSTSPQNLYLQIVAYNYALVRQDVDGSITVSYE